MKVCAVITAAGSGKRMGGSVKKQYLKMQGKEILVHTVERFEKCNSVDEIAVVTGKDEVADVRAMLSGLIKVKAVVEGGSERQYSVYNGLRAVAGCDIVLIHDGVRPFVSCDDIESCIKMAANCGACVLGVRVKDTIKVCDGEGVITDTPSRSTLWAAQTPQCFRYDLILNAFERAARDGFLGTDDASVAEYCGIRVKMCEGSYDNIKITTPEDLLLGDMILRKC